MPVNWSAIDRRSILGRFLRLPLRLLPRELVMTIRRGPAKGMKWIVGSSNHGCWLGPYELDKQQALTQFVRTGMTVYDIGAQAGFYTLFFSRLVGEGKVYAFEPFAENVQHLLWHIRMNGVRNAQVIQVALAERVHLAGFTVDRGISQNALIDAVNASLLVPTLSLDEAVEIHGLTPPDLIKMDVEGAESVILKGVRRTLERYRPTVFFLCTERSRGAAASPSWRTWGIDFTPWMACPLSGH
jgi:FkbM family methyltransferase